ncbi:alpha/beta fold hydrolase [Nocardia panacis]|uniref:alpha/beta fold hydrolase n=1 Tax=Nocardia panacis TaxID=2340916 RepID=UPI0013150897|nr:alpha/beta hydrolase [Nocardia panacis]
MPTFQHRGRTVVYDRWGAGPPLVLLHNAGTQRHIWDEQVAALRRTREVFALDLPGFGESDQPADGYRLADYVHMLEDFLIEQRRTGVVLVGNCLGAATSLSYAMAHPELVRALVLINPLTRNTVYGGRSAPLVWADTLLPLGPLAERLELPRPLISRIINDQLGSRGRARKLGRAPKLTAHWGDRGRLRALHGMVQDFENYRALDTFTPPSDFPPLCTIWGAQNRILSARAGADLNRTLRPQASAVLDDCGHLPMVENPERVTAIITEFLASEAVARPLAQ